jgi:hypothetical protein
VPVVPKERAGRLGRSALPRNFIAFLHRSEKIDLLSKRQDRVVSVENETTIEEKGA